MKSKQKIKKKLSLNKSQIITVNNLKIIRGGNNGGYTENNTQTTPTETK